MDVKQSLLNLSSAKLKKATALKEKIESLHNELAELLLEVTPGPIANVMRKKRTMSASAKKRISDAAKARWAKVRAANSK